MTTILGKRPRPSPSPSVVSKLTDALKRWTSPAKVSYPQAKRRKTLTIDQTEDSSATPLHPNLVPNLKVSRSIELPPYKPKKLITQQTNNNLLRSGDKQSLLIDTEESSSNVKQTQPTTTKDIIQTPINQITDFEKLLQQKIQQGISMEEYNRLLFSLQSAVRPTGSQTPQSLPLGLPPQNGYPQMIPYYLPVFPPMQLPSRSQPKGTPKKTIRRISSGSTVKRTRPTTPKRTKRVASKQDKIEEIVEENRQSSKESSSANPPLYASSAVLKILDAIEDLSKSAPPVQNAENFIANRKNFINILQTAAKDLEEELVALKIQSVKKTTLSKQKTPVQNLFDTPPVSPNLNEDEDQTETGIEKEFSFPKIDSDKQKKVQIVETKETSNPTGFSFNSSPSSNRKKAIEKTKTIPTEVLEKEIPVTKRSPSPKQSPKQFSTDSGLGSSSLFSNSEKNKDKAPGFSFFAGTAGQSDKPSTLFSQTQTSSEKSQSKDSSKDIKEQNTSTFTFGSNFPMPPTPKTDKEDSQSKQETSTELSKGFFAAKDLTTAPTIAPTSMLFESDSKPNLGSNQSTSVSTPGGFVFSESGKANLGSGGVKPSDLSNPVLFGNSDSSKLNLSSNQSTSVSTPGGFVFSESAKPNLGSNQSTSTASLGSSLTDFKQSAPKLGFAFGSYDNPPKLSSDSNQSTSASTLGGFPGFSDSKQNSSSNQSTAPVFGLNPINTSSDSSKSKTETQAPSFPFTSINKQENSAPAFLNFGNSNSSTSDTTQSNQENSAPAFLNFGNSNSSTPDTTQSKGFSFGTTNPFQASFGSSANTTFQSTSGFGSPTQQSSSQSFFNANPNTMFTVGSSNPKKQRKGRKRELE